jgi:hypothetical protein
VPPNTVVQFPSPADIDPTMSIPSLS